MQKIKEIEDRFSNAALEYDHGFGHPEEADKEFYSHAKEDIRYLLNHIETLQAENDKLNKYLREIENARK